MKEHYLMPSCEDSIVVEQYVYSLYRDLREERIAVCFASAFWP